MDGFQSHETFSNLVVGKHTYNLTKFPRFDQAQSGSVCKVDRQALSYVIFLHLGVVERGIDYCIRLKSRQVTKGNKLVDSFYLRSRKRVACVYGVIMHAGNVRRIREKRVKHEA